MIMGTLRLLPLPDRRAEVLEILRSIQGPALAQPGCLACHVYEEHGLDDAIALVERWESEATLEAHISSKAYKRILSAIELSCAPPEVCFDFISASEGMELIERSLSRRSQPGGGSADQKSVGREASNQTTGIPGGRGGPTQGKEVTRPQMRWSRFGNK
jgi:quinol monooxygenase YgiN